jgi:hypothetical protein
MITTTPNANPVKCDGNHAMPRCHAETCWHDDPPVNKCPHCGAEEMDDIIPAHLRFEHRWRCETPFFLRYNGAIQEVNFRTQLCREREARNSYQEILERAVAENAKLRELLAQCAESLEEKRRMTLITRGEKDRLNRIKEVLSES